MIKADEVVLKTGVLGRVKTPAARREQLLDEFERSGLSGTEVCGGGWASSIRRLRRGCKKRRRQRGGVASAKVSVKTPEQLRWLEAVVEQAQNPGGQNLLVLVLELPGGARVEIGD